MTYSTINLPISEARCDWITCTAKHDERGVELLHFAIGWLEGEAKLGYKQTPYHLHGYQGFQTKHIRYGWGEHGALVVLSGDAAAEYCYSVAVLADHWSRVDYCVTVRDEAGEINPVQHYRDEVKRHATKPKGWPEMGRYEEMWGGDTFYIGRRISPYYLRVYNKTAESDGDYPPGSWRWEVEMKRHASEAAQARARQSGINASYIGAFLANELNRLGLTVPWSPEISVKRDPQIKHRPDADRKVKWMETSLRPSVDFVTEALGVDRVLTALNLPHIRYADPVGLEAANRTL